MLAALNSGTDNDSAKCHKTDVEKFIRKFSSLCQYLKEAKKTIMVLLGYYVPYFTEMDDKGLTEVIRLYRLRFFVKIRL
jgi:hypothetical protein